MTDALSVQEVSVFLEIQLSADLNPPGRVRDSVVNTSEQRVVQNRSRIVERRMIGKVANIGTQIKADGFSDLESLSNRDIQLIINGRDKVVAWCVAELSGRGRGEQRTVSGVEPEVPGPRCGRAFLH